MKVTGKERQRQGLSGYSAAPLAYTAAHEIGFVGRDYGKHGPIGAQRPLTQVAWRKYGPIGAQRPLTQVTWQVWAYRRAAATHTGDLASMGLSARSDH